MNTPTLPELNIHSIVRESAANGPGNRTVIWVQGCSLGCEGCFNPDTHPFHLGTQVNPLELADQICSLENFIEGITITGGEPLFQVEALEYLLISVRNHSRLSVILLTGFEWEEINQTKGARLLPYIDVLISGRYDKNQRVAHRFIGSANKKFHFLTERYSLKDFEVVPACEVTIDSDGNTLITGIDPLLW